ncbi:MAG TPA: c-type cytochrome domain-containing protein [Verrucomicrobiae bacterium]
MVVLHFPIGFLTLAAVMEMGSWIKPFEGAKRLIDLTLALSAIAAVLTVALGLMRASGGGYAPDVLAIHRMAGIGVAVLSVVTWLLHRGALHLSGPGTVRLFYRGSLLLTLGVLTVAGHQGGTLTHGKGFLSANSPRAIKSILGEETAAAPTGAPTPEPGVAEALADQVQVILEHKCVSCHGGEKQKGKFRVDVRDTLLKGGKSGHPAIVPGDPLNSNLLRLVTLPRNNDDAMPPDGKEALTAQEIATILEWVQAGAPVAAKPSGSK